MDSYILKFLTEMLGPIGLLLGIVVLISRRQVAKTFERIKKFEDNQHKMTEEYYELLRENTNKIATIIKIQENEKNKQCDIIEDLVKCTEETREEIEHLKQAIQGKGSTLNSQQVYNMVGIYSGKVHSSLYLWWLERLEKNHILLNEELVKARYTQKLNEILNRWNGQLVQYSHNHIPLTKYDGGGLAQMYKEIMQVLFETQKSFASGKPCLYTQEGIQSYLDRRQSVLMGAATSWASNGNNLLEYMKEENLPMEQLGNIEWLIKTDEKTKG